MLQEESPQRLYTRQFFQVGAAVVLFMTGLSLQFHFGQYMAYLGHDVDVLGQILSLAIVGTLLIRLRVGRWIDRFGCRPVWLVGTLVVALAMGTIQFVTQVWLIVILRAVSQMASAAVMTTMAVFAAQIAPPLRRAESIGTIGMAGFLGMILGPTLGDRIFAGDTSSIWPYRVFFSASAGFSLLACGTMILRAMPSKPPREVPQVPDVPEKNHLPSALPSHPSQLRVVIHHWPGAILLVGVVFHMGFCLQTAFLERLAEARDFKDIKLFFLVYGPTAIVLRVIFRRVPQQVGRTRTVVGGLILFALGLAALVGVHSQQQLILPGLLMGAGHCFIFPSMVDLAATRLPVEHRGTGTSLILGAGDVGMLLGYVFLGELIETYGFDEAILTLAIIVAGGAVVFALANRPALFARRKRA